MTLNFAPKRSSDRTLTFLFNSLTCVYLALLPRHWALSAKVHSTPTFIYIYIYLSTITNNWSSHLSTFASFSLRFPSFIRSPIYLFIHSPPVAFLSLISVPFVLSLPSLSDVDGPVLFRKGMSWQSFSGDCLDPKVQKLAKENLVKAFIDVFGQDFGLMADDISIACGKSRRNEKSVLPEAGN